MNSIKKHIALCRLFTVPLLCLCLSLATLPQTSCTPTTPKSTHNITITVPEGTQSHGNPNLLCTPTRWTDIAVFFFANYVAHAATIKSIPGMPALGTLRVLLTALCLPVSGVTRGVKAIRQRAIFSSTPLETAAKAGALCIVVRTAEWMPQRGDMAYVSGYQFPERHPTWPLSKFCHRLNHFLWRSSALRSVLDHFDHKYAEFIRGLNSSNAQLPTNREGVRERPHLRIEWRSTHFLPSTQFLPSISILNTTDRKVHGICSLPHGYALAILPARAPIMEIRKDKRDEMGISHISSWYQRLKDALKTLKYTRDSRLATENGIELRVPRSRDHDPPNPDVRPEIELSSNYNLPKGLIAVF